VIFASFIFLFWFLPLALGTYYATPRRYRNLTLTVSSYVFYGWWRPDYLPLILASTTIDWAIALRMGTPQQGRPHRRRWLILSLVLNLGLLGYFKYANLVVQSVNDLLAHAGQTAIPWQAVVLPVGISFYTFQSLSYTVDVYRGEVQPLRSYVDFACFVSMFPQLVAGPIVRYADIEAELRDRRETWAKFADGVTWFCFGFAKKILIADNAALLADPAFSGGELGAITAWVGVTAYAVQIYFDFSGYSDMAIGLGKMLGFTFPTNFESPYCSESITEFWRRWHITLSTWLRDYLYVPLGGNRHGTVRTNVNLLTTMLLGGLWHGASWTFLFWGAYQGTWLVLERALGRRALWKALPRPARIGCTFMAALFGWALFRATSAEHCGTFWAAMCGLSGLGTIRAPELHVPHAWFGLAAGLAIAWFGPRVATLAMQRPTLAAWSGAVFAVVALGQLLSRGYTPFLYFQF
jgi:alginate O-acetyltransferase complex protein AlgI